MHEQRACQQRQEFADKETQARLLDEPWAARFQGCKNIGGLSTERIDGLRRRMFGRRFPVTAGRLQTAHASHVKFTVFKMTAWIVRTAQQQRIGARPGAEQGKQAADT